MHGMWPEQAAGNWGPLSAPAQARSGGGSGGGQGSVPWLDGSGRPSAPGGYGVSPTDLSRQGQQGMAMPLMPPTTWNPVMAGPFMAAVPAAQFQAQQSSVAFSSRGRDAATSALQKFQDAEWARSQGLPDATDAHRQAADRAEINAGRLPGGDPALFLGMPQGARGPGGGDRGSYNAAASSSSGAVAPQGGSATHGIGGTTEDGEEKRYQGKIKAFNAMTGFGFINCPEIMMRCGCDVFLNVEVLGGTMIGGTVSFSVEFNKHGKPQARQVVLEEKPSAPGKGGGRPDQPAGVQAMIGQLHRGRIKSFNAQRGYGFVSAMEVQKHFSGRDIYVSKNQAPDGRFIVGQSVDFRLAVDRQGQPQARDIKIVESNPRNAGAPGSGGGDGGSASDPSSANQGIKLF